MLTDVEQIIVVLERIISEKKVAFSNEPADYYELAQMLPFIIQLLRIGADENNKREQANDRI